MKGVLSFVGDKNCNGWVYKIILMARLVYNKLGNLKALTNIFNIFDVNNAFN